MGLAAYARPVVYADESTRVQYLRRVGTLTAAGLGTAGIVGGLSAMFLAPSLMGSQWGSLILILGCLYGAPYIARRTIAGGQGMLGLLAGSAAIGVAMGQLLFVAAMVASGTGQHPMALIAQAGGYTALTALSMVVYLWSGPKDLSMIRGAMRVLFPPMLILMVVSFIWPSAFGGMIGIGLSLLFIGISGAGLLYTLNQVMHSLRSDQIHLGAFELTFGLLILFWNILSLLIRLQGRD